MLVYREHKVKMTTEVQYDRSFIWIWIILELQICKQKKKYDLSEYKFEI